MMLSVTPLCVIPVQKSVFLIMSEQIMFCCLVEQGGAGGGVEAHHQVPPHTLPSERDKGGGGQGPLNDNVFIRLVTFGQSVWGWMIDS